MVGKLYSDRSYSDRLCSDRFYSDKCYSNWNSHRQTGHYALHQHSPGGDNFMCNRVRFCS